MWGEKSAIFSSSSTQRLILFEKEFSSTGRCLSSPISLRVSEALYIWSRVILVVFLICSRVRMKWLMNNANLEQLKNRTNLRGFAWRHQKQLIHHLFLAISRFTYYPCTIIMTLHGLILTYMANLSENYHESLSIIVLWRYIYPQYTKKLSIMTLVSYVIICPARVT